MKHATQFGFTLLFVFTFIISQGQASLSKKISLDVNRQRLDNVLEILNQALRGQSVCQFSTTSATLLCLIIEARWFCFYPIDELLNLWILENS